MSSSTSSRDCYQGIKCSAFHCQFMSLGQSRTFPCCLDHFASRRSYWSQLLFCLLLSGSSKLLSFHSLVRLATSAATNHSTPFLAKPSKRPSTVLSSTASRSAITLRSVLPSSKAEASLSTAVLKLKCNSG